MKPIALSDASHQLASYYGTWQEAADAVGIAMKTLRQAAYNTESVGEDAFRLIESAYRDVIDEHAVVVWRGLVRVEAIPHIFRQAEDEATLHVHQAANLLGEIAKMAASAGQRLRAQGGSPSAAPSNPNHRHRLRRVGVRGL